MQKRQDYRLLGYPLPQSKNQIYRGIYRPEPQYDETLPPTSGVNQLWLEETDLMTSDSFDNIETAKRIQRLYAQSGKYFDLVRVIHGSEREPDLYETYLGCDITHASGYSLLSWNLSFREPAPEFFHQRDNPVYQPLLELIERHFRPLLNKVSLFSATKDAEFFLRVANAMTAGFQTVWEDSQYGPFGIVRLYMMHSISSLEQEFG